MLEEIKLTAIVKDETVEIFADKFSKDWHGRESAETARPARFEHRALFTHYGGEPTLVVSAEEARRFAKEILRDTGGD